MSFITDIAAKGASIGASALANWQALAIKGLAILVICGAIFGYGYHVGTMQCVNAQIAHTDVAVAAQHDQDKHQAAAATGAGQKADARHNASDAAVKPVIERIKGDTIYVRIPVNDPHACDLTPTALDLLNEAGDK